MQLDVRRARGEVLDAARGERVRPGTDGMAMLSVTAAVLATDDVCVCG